MGLSHCKDDKCDEFRRKCGKEDIETGRQGEKNKYKEFKLLQVVVNCFASDYCLS